MDGSSGGSGAARHRLTPDVRLILESGVRAPSGHNTQPWRFDVDGDTIRVLPDLGRRLPVVDPDDHALFISLGCAVENMVVAARHLGMDAAVSIEADGSIFVRLTDSAEPPRDELYEAIAKRQSNRGAYDGRPVPDDHLTKLLDAAAREGVRVLPFVGQDGFGELLPFIAEGNRAQFADREFVNELISWVRFSDAEAQATQDGLWSRCMGVPAAPRWLGSIFMRLFTSPKSEAARCEKLVRSSSALVLFAAEGNDYAAWVNVGRSFQRLALTATSLGISHAHVNMPCEVVSVRRRLAEHLSLDTAQPLLLIRLGYASPLPYSMRRPLTDVLVA
ncbi:MAG: nitroreductase family protein [Acidobacteriota bacterium]|nr:nitroreductase family protein [Acidobacteriota bacterium]